MKRWRKYVKLLRVFTCEKMNKKTVIVGIPAFNEEKNIGVLLESILLQKGNNFTIDKVIVVCDGSRDNTAEIVKLYSKKFNQISLKDDNKRKGKAARLNEFYKSLK